jgi:DNA helicase-2/ATP-dependent DNA helicase PcrA
MNFEQDFPNAEIVVLAENYRSTKTILAAANDAIEKNIQRKEKELYTKNADGEKITVAGFYDETEEARYVAKEAKYLSNYGVKPENIAVLYRANFQSRILEEAFLKENVPYQVLGTRFFERKEVKDAVAYIKLALNPDSSADLARAIGTPSRGIGKVTLVKIVNGKEAELPAAARKKIQDFRALLSRIQNKIDTVQASEAIRFALHESGMWNLYAHGSSEDTERLENLKELVTVATKYDHLPAPEGIEKLIEEAALQSDQDELKEKKVGVKLMTIHAAKGLEFERVFITGLEEGLFPHERDEADGVDQEEERRLFYVALTRAEKKVYLTHAATRRIFGTRSINTPSEFVTELDPALVEIVPFIGNYHEETID